MPKSLIKQLKQYALDHDTTLTAIAIESTKKESPPAENTMSSSDNLEAAPP
ncbi:MAG: hypothetical protein M3044_08505 [Thermoproteota archaeon]|nr:hypothetical protein [Thermoproteota archaeon]